MSHTTQNIKTPFYLQGLKKKISVTYSVPEMKLLNLTIVMINYTCSMKT